MQAIQQAARGLSIYKPDAFGSKNRATFIAITVAR